MGINSREQLAEAEAAFQVRARRKAMEEGATLIAPETVWLSFDTSIGRDVIIEPNVFFGPGVVVEDGAQILANCHFVGTHASARGARVGPFARTAARRRHRRRRACRQLRRGQERDPRGGRQGQSPVLYRRRPVGEGANIGAGTIFCNYDGFNKHFTDVGKGAFVGSNTSLVAPVKIGDGAYIGSGSVITKDVAPDALALERSAQEQRPGWAAKFRAMMSKTQEDGLKISRKNQETDFELKATSSCIRLTNAHSTGSGIGAARKPHVRHRRNSRAEGGRGRSRRRAAPARISRL